MTLKHWDDQELAKVSADLDAELEQIFDEMEIMLGPPTAQGDAASGDQDDGSDVQADSFENAASAIAPARDKEIVDLGEPLAPPLPPPGEDNPQRGNATPQLDGDSSAASEPRRGNAPPQFSGGLNTSAGNGHDSPITLKGLNNPAAFESDLPEAEVLPDDYDEQIPKPAAADESRTRPAPSPPVDLGLKTIADLSPDEFARLMEKSVARGVLAALRKWRR